MNEKYMLKLFLKTGAVHLSYSKSPNVLAAFGQAIKFYKEEDLIDLIELYVLSPTGYGNQSKLVAIIHNPF